MVQELYSKMQEETVEKIIEERSITPFFQPIVSLRDGTVYGYEALSRVSDCEIKMSSDDLFTIASASGKAWRLEQICRSAILTKVNKNARIFNTCKLFLNISPQVLVEDMFYTGFDEAYLSRYSVEAEGIVFEITEKDSVSDTSRMNELVTSYKNRGFEIAIDDLGSCYSGLNLVCEIAPKYIKLDRSLINQVSKNNSRYILIKNLVDYANSMNIKLIAEGIETSDDLSTLIKLGIHYGQGYFIARPNEELNDINDEIYQMIIMNNIKKNSMQNFRINQYYIKHLSLLGNTVSKEVKIESLIRYFDSENNAQGICITEKEKVIGILTTERFQKLLSGRYGFSLYQYKNVSEIMDKNFLEVDYMMPISSVSSIAMQREGKNLYDFIVVTKQGAYYGIVTIKDLLMKSTEISIMTAKEENPLTGLPGNVMINEKISNIVVSKSDMTVMYIDMDNFKAFNDVYGFEKGDEIIKMLAGILMETADHTDFVGHIGGDDFIFMTQKNAPEMISKYIQNKFDDRVLDYYNEEDRKNNYIVSNNRKGVIEQIPLVSLTIACLSGKEKNYNTSYEITEELARRKKEIKDLKYKKMKLHDCDINGR